MSLISSSRPPSRASLPVSTDASSQSYLVRQSSGIREASDHTRLLDGWGLRYAQISRGSFQGSLNEAWIEGVHLYRESLSQSVFQSGHVRQGSISLGVFSSLSGTARWFGQDLTTDDIMLLNSGCDLVLSTPKESSLLVLCIPESESLSLPRESEARHFIRQPELAQALRSKIQDALYHLTTHPLNFVRHSTRWQFRMDMEIVVEEHLRRIGGEPADPCRNRAVSVVRTAMDHVLERRGEMMSIDDLCEATYTSRRNLQKCFERVTGESPALFLKAQRLNAVRQSILNEGGERLIGDIAIDWGFWHFSQFSVDYKRHFGESPSDTAQYARRRRLM